MKPSVADIAQLKEIYNRSGMFDKDVAFLEEILWLVMLGIPEPRMTSLKELMAMIAYTRLGSEVQAADFLGMSKAGVHDILKRQEQIG